MKQSLGEGAQAKKGPDKFNLRMPPGMRERVKKAKDKNGRSMNSELIARLETSFDFEPAELLSMIEQLKMTVERLTKSVDAVNKRLGKL